MKDARPSVSPRMPSYSTLSVQELDRRREQEAARQEQALDEIHHGVKGLKHHAVANNDEVLSQISTLDGMTEEVDGAQLDLERGEKQAREVNAKKAAICKLVGFVAVLVAAEVVMTVVGVRFI